MNENVKVSCACELGYDKGALKKTIENNIFTVYGNVLKNNYILLRYHGQLIDKIDYENYTNNIYISYIFNNDEETRKIVPLAKCSKCIGENYCILISLDNYDKIDFEFYIKGCDNITNLSLKETTTFKLDIKSDPLTDVYKKYVQEENHELPIITNKNEIQLQKIINSIKDFFVSLFKSRKNAA